MNYQDGLACLSGQAVYMVFLEQNLTPARLQHSLEVMTVMGNLAEAHGLDLVQALTVGLLHDAAKDMPASEMLKLAHEAHFDFHYPCEWTPMYLHGPVGAWLMHEKLGVDDPAVLEAVYRHTWVEGSHWADSKLTWCMRFADFLAPSRSWRTFNRRLEPAAFDPARFGEARSLVTQRAISLGDPVHPLMFKIREKALQHFPVQITPDEMENFS